MLFVQPVLGFMAFGNGVDLVQETCCPVETCRRAYKPYASRVNQRHREIHMVSSSYNGGFVPGRSFSFSSFWSGIDIFNDTDDTGIVGTMVVEGVVFFT